MNLKRMGFVVAICALVGALAGIAGSAAAPSKSDSKASAAAKAKAKAKALDNAKRRELKRSFRFGPGPGPGGPFGGGPLHSEAVVPQADGSGFDTVTMDRGDLLSVDGNTLHVKQADGNNVYKDDAAITVGSDVKVIRNHEDAKLSDLKAGDHVRIITGAPKGDIVIAEDDAFQAQEKKKFKEHFGGRHHGFGPGGPPPGAPGKPDDPNAPGDYPGGDDSGSGSGSNS